MFISREWTLSLLLLTCTGAGVWVRLGELQVGSYRLEQGPANLFCKVQDNILDLEGHNAFVATAQFCQYSTKAAQTICE